MRELGNQVEEANILNSIAMTYNTIGQPQRALSPFQQALLIIRELGDREAEAAILNNMGLAYQLNGQSQEALSCYEQTLPILQEAGNHPMEATILANIATLLYQQFNRAQDAITYLEQAINILNQMGLRQDAAGQTLELFNHWLQAMQYGKPLISQADIVDGLQNEEVVDRQTENLDLFDVLIRNTIAVLGPRKDKQQEWHGTLVQMRSQAREQGIHNLVVLLDAIIGLLEAKGNPAGLGANLAGAEAKIWQDIVTHLSTNG
jgi:tetratricopeptide (TPR) repeat protein